MGKKEERRVEDGEPVVESDDVTVATTTADPSPVTPELDPRIYNKDGKPWRDIANGLSGAIQQIKDRAAKEAGALKETIKALEQDLTARDAEILNLKEEIKTLKEEITNLKDALAGVDDIKERAAQAEKLSVLLDFPELLSARIEETVKGEDGEERVVVKNPYRDLVMSSQLPKDELAGVLRDLASALPTHPAGQPQSPMIPSPGKPVGSDDLSAWETKLEEARKRMLEGDNSAFEDFQKAAEEIRRLKSGG